MYDLSSAWDGNKVSSHSLFLVSLDLAAIHLYPSSLLPPLLYTHMWTDAAVHSGTSLGDIISQVQPGGSHSWSGGAPVMLLLCVCCTQSQAGLVTICIGKAPASHEPPSQLLQARSKPDIKAGILPYLEGACFLSLVLSHKDTYLCFPLSFLIFPSSLCFQ